MKRVVSSSFRSMVFPSASKAATILVDGWFELAYGRQTMNWLRFEVLSPEPVTGQAWINVGNSDSSWLVLGGANEKSPFKSFSGPLRWSAGAASAEAHGRGTRVKASKVRKVRIKNAGSGGGSLRRQDGP